jgi:GH15 family glucan-1,4-alpha-glucosidase
MTVDALSVAACDEEAVHFLEFVATAGADSGLGTPAPIMYGIRGERCIPETELDHLAGHGNARPVRIGNGAWKQRQNDVFGSVIDAAYRLATRGGDDRVLTPRIRALIRRLADRAAAEWREPDHGLWEVRGAPRHHLASKLMCWVALDRAIELAPRIGATGRVRAWDRERTRIRDVILRQGWSEEAGAYTGALGSPELDAAALQLGLYGFLPWDAPRLRATVDVLRERLGDGDGFVHRAETTDGDGDEEGSFTLCTCWMVQALAGCGEHAAARQVFERLLTRANDVGLLAEQLADDGRRMLGNMPQAYSHVGVIEAAAALGETTEGA